MNISLVLHALIAGFNLPNHFSLIHLWRDTFIQAFNSEAFVSELQDNVEEMYCTVSDVFSRNKSLMTHWCVTRRKKVKLHDIVSLNSSQKTTKAIINQFRKTIQN